MKRRPPQIIVDELDRLFDQFVEQEHYSDDSIFDEEKYKQFVKDNASKEAYHYAYEGEPELIKREGGA